MRIPCDNLGRLDPQKRRPGALYLELKDKLNDLHEHARQHQQSARERQERNHKTSCQLKYNVGDLVWLRQEATKGHPKLHKPRQGPYEITETLPPLSYRLRSRSASQ